MAVQQKRESREAVEKFRARADAIRTELMDETKVMTVDEVKAKEREMQGYEARAVAAAGFTPDREIADQGGDTDPHVLRVDGGSTVEGRMSPRHDPDDPDAVPEVSSVDDVVKDLAKDCQRYFGNVREFCRAFHGRTQLNKTQQRILTDCAKMAQLLFPDDGRAGQTTIQGRTITGTGGSAQASVLLPLQQVPSIFAVPNVLMGILQGAARYTVAGRTLRIPYVVQTGTAVTRPLAGIANVSIISEGQTKPPAEPTYLQRVLTVQKWAAIAQIGDETLGDDFTGQLAPNVTNQVGGQVINSMNEYMTINGNDSTGASQPLGALNASNPSLLVVNRNTKHQFTINDVFQMFQQHTHGPKSMWLISRRVIRWLYQLTLSGTTLVTFISNLNSIPGSGPALGAGMLGYLLGYPIYISDILPSVGNQSDVNLVNPEFYAAAIRQNLTVESSIHVAFTADVTTYRFLARGGGIPIPDGTYAYQVSGGSQLDPHSPFVTLGPAVSS